MFNESLENKNYGFRNFLNNLNPSLIKKSFKKRNNLNRRKNDLIIDTQNTVTFESNSLRCLGPHI